MAVADRRKIVLATFGSFGDVHPFIALAHALRDLGFAPVIATAESYRSKVEAEGLPLHPMRPDLPDLEREIGVGLPEVVRRVREGEGDPVREFIVPFLRPSYEDLLAAADGASLVASNHLALSAGLAAETRGLPHVFVALTPSVFLSAFDPPRLGALPFARAPGTALGAAWNRLLLSGVRAASARLVSRPVRRFRRELGLPAAGGDPILDGARRAHRAIGLYSPTLGDVKPDFPAGSAVVGFTFYDRERGGEGEAGGPDPELAAFLDGGEPPLVFTLGSLAVMAPGDFYRSSAEAARRLGRRAVLLMTAEERDAFPTEGLAPDILVRDYVPHSAIFPRAAAVIHHGGAGTTGQALRAGKPQLVVPFLADQPDNADRLVRLGVARALSRGRYDPDRAARALTALLSEPSYAATAGAVAEVVRREDGAPRAARLIADLLAAPAQASPSRRAGVTP